MTLLSGHYAAFAPIFGITTGATFESIGRPDLIGQPIPIDRFVTKIDKTQTCWKWLGSKTGNGYGQFFVAKSSERKTINAYAHRWYYELVVGPIPAGLELDHLCKVRDCVNPDHLEPVTRRENLLRSDGLAAIAAAKTHCPQGHEYSPQNTTVSGGSRYCKACRAARNQTPAYQAKRAANMRAFRARRSA